MIHIALLVAVIAAVGFGATDRVLAGEWEVTTSDATATVTPVQLSKTLVIDLKVDAKNVVIADPTVVNAIVIAPRRVFIIGKAVGQSNVFMYAADGHEIAALDVWVTIHPPPNAAWREKAVVIFRAGEGFRYLDCTSYADCRLPREQKQLVPEGLDVVPAGAAGAK